MTSASPPVVLGDASIATFRCAKRNLKLTQIGCARLHASATTERPEAWEGRAECRLCATGAANRRELLGGPLPSDVPVFAAAEVWQAVCVRCRRVSDRLVRRRLCPSCYNRQREVTIGRNAKGSRPALTDVLRRRVVAVADTDGRISRAQEDLAVSALEVMLATAKSASGPVAFGWAGAHG